ncbi:uncharacterized protein I303_100945 [Kwoniella dejecticola CBS 10117]|uniref:BD-FAE-like domain-containing protein n=1 Tax=Kwoniella dejecticola CBS 10117 TaxID=1296121 RepID=A0A1A6AGD4_9TREE|nr:uncharacterized protein I303_00949 [Kwoniella dejecticola CBS 10117]OBR89127.1 hypothetical protein I303_00949 [Kwoniella dejecticola CBS 10117]
MFGRDSPARPSMREQIAAKRAEYANSPAGRQAAASHASAAAASASPAPRRTFARAEPDEGKMADKTVEGELKKAVRSGKLDLCSLSLPSIPPEVYTALLGIPADELSKPPLKEIPSSDIPQGSELTVDSTPPKGLSKDDERTMVFGSKTAKKAEWIEPEELTSMRIAENSLSSLEREIGMFGALERLDLSRNQLKELPNSIADLLRLTSLDLSFNSFTSVPPAVLVLPALQVLDLSHNAIHALSFADPIGPSEDGLAYGAGFFTTFFERQAQLKMKRPVFPVLRSFNLGFSKLNIPGLKVLGQTKLSAMRVLNLESNLLQGVLDFEEYGMDADSMPILVSLILCRNTNLRGTTGKVWQDAKVDLSGCNLRESTPQPPSPSPNRTNKSANDPAQDVDNDRHAGGEGENLGSDKAIPNPDLTLVYRTLPAETFDSEPLPVDFDVYLPPKEQLGKGKGKGHAVVIWFHGGGLLQGNKENLPPHFRRLPGIPLTPANGSSEGETENVIVISPNYRLSPQTPILGILEDVEELLSYIRTKLNARLKSELKVDTQEDLVDTSRICLSGGSAGGYLALIAGFSVPKQLTDEEVGGYRGLKDKSGIKCLAPFYPITDLVDTFWATETDPVPWKGVSVPHADAAPHLNPKSPSICSATSGGPRSILYPYMLQHGLFPSLLFRNQKSIGYGLDSFRPTPESLSIPHRLDLARSKGQMVQLPTYFVYGTIDDKVQPMDKTLKAFENLKGQSEGVFTIEKIEGGDHAYDEDPEVECEDFRAWLAKTLL